MKVTKSYERVTKSYKKLPKVTKSYKRVIGTDLEASFCEFLENSLSVRGVCGPHHKNMSDLIWTLCGHLRPPLERAGMISFGSYVSTFGPHPKDQRFYHLDPMWAPSAPTALPCGEVTRRHPSEV